MLVAPSYNRYLDNLNEIGMRIWLLCLLIFTYTLGNLGSNFHDLEKALFFYTLGVYFNDYAEADRRKTWFIFLTIFGVIINGACQYGILSLTLSEATNAIILRKAFSMTGYILAEPLACIGIFGLFSKISIHSNFINKIASHTFGVYLFHEAKPLRNLIWIHILKPYRYYGNVSYYAYVIVCVVAVFLSGCIVDIVREKIFAKLYTKYADKLIDWFNRIGMKNV